MVIRLSANKTADALNTIKNSLVVATLTTVFNTVVGMMAAYILSRKDYKFLKWVYVFFMIGVLVPVHCTLIPINNIATALNAKNNLFFLILIYVAMIGLQTGKRIFHSSCQLLHPSMIAASSRFLEIPSMNPV